MLIPECPLCGGTERYYSFVTGDERFDECRRCGLLSHKAVRGVPTEAVEYGTARREANEPGLVDDLLALLERYAGSEARELAVLGSVSPAFVEAARSRGFSVTPLCGTEPAARYAVVVAMNGLEHDPAPRELVERLREHLRPGGVVVVVTRQLLKAGAQLAAGPVLEQRQRYSLSDSNLQTLLWQAGFSDVFLSHHVDGKDPIRAQGWFKDQAIALARMRERRPVPRLSVVVPVFQEAGTVGQVLEALEAKEIPGVELEVIVVESASTDGSREVVLRYRDRPRFRVVLEDRPRGKGFAVRTGLRHVTGDIVLIQDADLEYDLLDYEMLIEPILRGRRAFVLGTRHAGTWKIRKFAQHRLADMMNLAHWGLVYAMNRMYGQSMTDPFTMFKVFRADCLAGLTFECNRFDFDVELVCKLLRKGYEPLEIPVNYQARSFEEGKKVRILRDPLTWVRAMLKYRYSPVLAMPAHPGREAATPEEIRAAS